MSVRIRIKDVAQHLGISSSTVSRALNPKTSNMISSDVVTKVKRAADKLGYTMDFAAASLRNQRTYTVGVIIPDILNPVFPPIIKGIQEYLSKHDFVTFTLFTNNQQDQAIIEMKKLVSRRVDGVIIASAFLQDASVNYCIDNKIPLVTVNRSIKDGHLIHQVMDDEHHGIQLAIDHLIALGHTHILHIAGPQNILQGIKRKEAFVQYCRAQNLQAEIIHAESFTVEAGSAAARDFLTSKCSATAIVAGNDLIAVGAIQYLTAHNINVPSQVSIVGYNGMPFAEMLSPALTTVTIPAEQMGQQAARLLLNAIEDQEVPKQKVLLAPKLEVRASTAPPPHA